MSVSYKKLWKLLIDANMNKTDLRLAIGASSATMAKLSKDAQVSIDVLLRICQELKCDIGDIMVVKQPNEVEQRSYPSKNQVEPQYVECSQETVCSCNHV